MLEVDSSTLSISECGVVSEGSLSPFVISSGGGWSSSSISILSTKYEPTYRTIKSLPPLTSLAPPSNNRPSTLDFSSDGFNTAMNVIHASGLHLNEFHLGLGTGPLFDFGVLSSLSPAVPPTTTSLTHTSLRNVSSVVPETTRRLFPQTRQILVSCVVERSSNHFSGTATADVNMCGSFLAQNSSFAKCSSNLVASDEHPTYTLAHRTGENTITIETGAPAEDVEITRCTFKDMTSSTAASAIQFTETVGNTKIHECSFFNSSGTSKYGSVVYVEVVRNKYSVTFSSCVVVRCTGTSIFGGAIVIFNPFPLTCSDCVFFQTEGTQLGSALNVVNAQSGALTQISNSIFESAYAASSTNGSALCFTTSYNALISSLRFVDTQVAGARDLFCYECMFTFSEATVLNCQSSRSEFICETSFQSEVSLQDDLFTTITQEMMMESFSGIDNEDGTATFTIEVEDAVAGEMVVVVENLDSTRSSPPPIPRSLTFSFASPAKTASCTVDVGDAELIQSPVADYKIRRAGIADWLIHTFRVKSRTVSFNDAMKTRIDISLDCDGLMQAEYSILVQTEDKERTLPLTAGSDGTTLTATGQAYPIAGAALSYASDYTIVEVKDAWGQALIVPNAVTFRTPDEPPRINRMTYNGFDSTGEQLIMRVRGRQMPVGTYTIELSPGGHSFDVVFGAVKSGETLEERDSESVSIPIFGEDKKILYATLYSINAAFEKSTGSSEFVSQSETEMTTPVEPARITEITKVDYDSQFTQLTLSFSGINCVAAGHTVTVKNTATEESSPLVVIFDTPQTGHSTEYIWTEEGTTKLKFGGTYEVVGVTASSGEIFFTRGMTFDVVPARHRLLSAGTVVSDDHRNVSTVPLKGENMPIGTTTLKFLDSTHFSETSEDLYVDVNITFSTETDGLLRVEFYPTPQLVYGHTYVTWAMNRTGIDETMFVTRYNTIQMPTEPTRLEKVTGILSDDAKQVTLQFEGRMLDSGEYEVTLHTAVSSTEMVVHLIRQGDGTLSCSISTEEADTPHVVFGQTSTITQMTKDSTPIIINPSAMKVTVPFPPPPEICVVVDRTGSATVEECGGSDKPCDSIGVGWEVGVRRDGEEGQAVVVKVRREVVFGGSVTVRGGTLRICSESSAMRRIIAEGALDENERSGKGLVNVAGGRVEMDEVLLVLPISSTLDSSRVVSVIWGRGEVRLSSVEIVQKESGRVGMGMVCVESGVVEMKSVKAANVWMEDGVALLRVESGVKSVRMEIEECEFSDIHTLNSPLLSLSSRSPSSSLRLSTSSFVNVVSTLSPSTPPISIATCQAELTVSECVFTKCGLFSAAGIASGPTISFTLSSPTPLLTLSSCVFTGSFPSSTVSGIGQDVWCAGVVFAFASNCGSSKHAFLGLQFDCSTGTIVTHSPSTILINSTLCSCLQH
ncbi:hypothetical protein BLNAU_21997 [Blattamonas nauphoetae]|uniref:Uncharacterized protein n=1 Tax=Blattamonas nauphoetae TaxID=2049346 RepID=A0ABQ9WU97_9EUKA|nr:hypothetical protein BLNAU_21997 [Blattamonas nauphoetae]